MILLKNERNNDIEISTDLCPQYSFPIKGTRLLGEITDCRAQRGNIEESGRSYCIKKKVLKKKPQSNGVMSKKTGMSFQGPKL